MDDIRIAKELARLAKELMAYSTGKVQMRILNSAGLELRGNNDLVDLSRSSDPGKKGIFENSRKSIDVIRSSVEYWSKFNGKEDSDFRELLWSAMEGGDPILLSNEHGSAILADKRAEQFHDAYIQYLELAGKDQVKADIGVLRRKVKSKSISIDDFMSEVQSIKEKFKSMTKNNRLSTGEDDAWRELDAGRRWSIDGFDVYEVNEFRLLSAVAGTDPETHENKTEWCVALEESFFKSYKPPYYLFAVDHRPETLVHIPSQQMKGIDDEPEYEERNCRAVLDFLVKVKGAFTPTFKCWLLDDPWSGRNDFQNLPEYVSFEKSRQEADDKIKAFVASGVMDAEPPVEILREWSNDRIASVRAWVAEYPKTPVDILEHLADDNYGTVKQALLRNSSLCDTLDGIGIIVKLAETDHHDADRIFADAARHPGVPKEKLEEWASSDEAEMRRAVAGNPSLPEGIMEKMLDDPDMQVRVALAGNPKVPSSILKKLAADEEYFVRADIVKSALNKDNASDILPILASDEEPSIRAEIARHPLVSGRILARLAKDPDEEVRRSAAANRNADERLLKALREDRSKAVRDEAEYRLANYNHLQI